MSDKPFAKKRLGQHWLEDNDSLQAMVDAGQVGEGDVVLEVGPGYGTLTELLLARSASVEAVELDETLAAQLRAKFAREPFQLHMTSILEFDFTSLPPDYKIVANIPYYLTSNLIRVISETSNQPACAVLLVQKEVAERVAALPGDMSLLSVSAQFYWQVSVGRIVKSELFTPPPKVDSQILVLKRHPSPLFPDVEIKRFFRLVKAGYSGRRKTLENALSGGLGISKQVAAALLAAAELPPMIRAQSLSLVQWHNLYQVWQAQPDLTK